MNWEAIGALAELVGAIGVIATLGYLAVQIRQNTGTVRSESQRAVFQSSLSTSLELAKDEKLAQLFQRGLRDFQGLTDDERTRFSFLMGNLIGSAAVAYDAYLYGVYDAAHWKGTRYSTRFLRTPGGTAWWRAFAIAFPEPFQQYVEREVLRPETAEREAGASA